MMTAVCGTLSVTTLGLAFLFGPKHGYLLYSGATAAILLRNQRQTLQEFGNWLKDEYFIAKEFILQYTAKKTGAHRPVVKKSSRNVAERTTESPYKSPQQVTDALEKVGATSLTNCLVSGIGFGIASIGVLGDMD